MYQAVLDHRSESLDLELRCEEGWENGWWVLMDTLSHVSADATFEFLCNTFFRQYSYLLLGTHLYFK